MKALKELLQKITPSHRRKIYRIAVVIIGLLGAKGMIQAEDAAAMLEILGLTLGAISLPVMADANVNEG